MHRILSSYAQSTLLNEKPIDVEVNGHANSGPVSPFARKAVNSWKQIASMDEEV